MMYTRCTKNPKFIKNAMTLKLRLPTSVLCICFQNIQIFFYQKKKKEPVKYEASYAEGFVQIFLNKKSFAKN